jgi:ABC-type multidrug transport system ATPase subunit
MDETSRCHRVGFMRQGKMIEEGMLTELRSTLDGRILELRGGLMTTLPEAAQKINGVEDLRLFGDKLHLRVVAGRADSVLSALAIALVHTPKLLFLDEPTSGVDAMARRVFWDLIYTLAVGGVTVFVTTHYMEEAEYCGRVGTMRDGKLLALDTPAALKDRIVPGDVWEVQAGPLQAVLDACSTCAGVLRVRLAGDHLRMIADRGMKEKELRARLNSAGLVVDSMISGEPTLEDVFLSLAKG